MCRRIIYRGFVSKTDESAPNQNPESDLVAVPFLLYNYNFKDIEIG